MLLDDMLKLAQTAARAAGSHARRFQGQFKPELKQGDQIVTEADRQCQALIFEAIGRRYPHHGLLGEEAQEGLLYQAAPTGSENIWWVIDPIDGTRNYAHGTPQFAVSIGVLQDGHPVVGVIYDPSTDMMFYARGGGPAYCNDKVIHCSGEPLQINSQIAVPQQYPDQVPPSLPTLLRLYGCLSLGSAALHFAYVAMGAYAAAFTNRVKLWDIAGGAAICQAAGATVTHLDGSCRFPFDCATYEGQSTPVLIAAAQNHRPLLDLLQASSRADNQ